MVSNTGPSQAVSDADLERVAETLDIARRTRTPIAPIAIARSISVDDAYRVQDGLVTRIVSVGDQIVGAKLGLTSRAKQETMGVHEPIFGQLTASMKLGVGESIRVADLIHPRVEPEIVFVLGKTLEGNVTEQDVLDGCASIHAGFEVIDSRYLDFKFSLVDVIVDNTSAARFVVSDKAVDPRTVDLTSEYVTLSVDGSNVDKATGADILGGPVSAVALLVRHLSRRGRNLPAGSLVLSGGLTNAVPIEPGRTVSAEFNTLGPITLKCL